MYFIKVDDGKIIGKGCIMDEKLKLDVNCMKVSEEIFKSITSLPCGYLIVKKNGDKITKIELDENDLDRIENEKRIFPTLDKIKQAQRQIQLINDLNELGVL